ncbi:MAG: glycosyltransferase [Candidatus Abyssobacteria bacterium SURF_17]|uniref:Glycosyltransferase n=1 Tax=Candidatus Abyssobacteria bacterium SURF_17 TaxID=2093361 RepID=A0A419F002_9BACT|nr:MAG: glycosyltransferase [Candidatus Abyssubacteria bacterium SURF_17]
MKVLHVFSNIHDISGYQVRSKYVLDNQKRMGLDLAAASMWDGTSGGGKIFNGNVPVFLFDVREGFKKLPNIPIPIPYLREAGREVRRYAVRRIFRSYLSQVIERTRPDIVHAHSSWKTALQAFAAARRARLPFLYEIRGVWEETAVAEREISRLGFEYVRSRFHENHLIRESDAIVTLSEGLKQDLCARGGNPNRISVIPNGVDTAEFMPVPRDVQLAESLACGQRTIVGYISSLRKLEGIKYLVQAMRKVDECICAVIVGDGSERESLERYARDLGVQDRIKFVGSVPHAGIARYYSIIDIFVVPRIRQKVCELVTPLKPLEAMAMGKCLLMSDVGGLRELASEEETAQFFEPENSESLADKLRLLVADAELRRKMGEKARRYVVEKRDWRGLVNQYIPIYENLMR